MTVKKLENLDNILKELKSLVIAFSGGVDSTFLLHRASMIKKVKVCAITIRTPYIPAREIEEAVSFCKEYQINHTILNVDFPDIIRHNPVERCYLCKTRLFSHIREFAEKNGYMHIADGSNADDNGDFRPGLKALAEMNIRSPLMESGLIKSEIRELSKKEGLPTWDKPAYACLLTRIPYDTRVTENDLSMIEKAEQYFFEKGFPGTRVRKHGEIARIECLPGYFSRLIIEEERSQVISNLKKIGFRFISLDLDGYKSGSLNPEKK
jgi:pyridinium-3,5-biscarboxylic acid mononucleotide sulfurtransferase